jgi:hypothetical protein
MLRLFINYFKYKFLSLIGGDGNWSYFKSLFGSTVEWKDITFVIVVSTGRTGTKFFEKFFNASTVNCQAYHEPYNSTIKLSIDYLKKNISEQKAIQLFLNHRKQLLTKVKKSGKNVLVESESNLVYLLPLIKKYIPNYKIIHVIRDPKDYVRSFASRTVDIKGQIHRKYDYDKFWKLLPGEIADPVQAAWKDMSVVGKGAWQWTHINSYIRKEIIDDPNSITVKFEDVFNQDNPQKGLKVILEFLDATIKLNNENPFEILTQKKNRTHQFLIEDFSKWNQSQKEAFNKQVSSLAMDYNYSIIGT